MEVFVQKNYIKISLGISVLLFLICSKVLFKTKKSNLPHPPPPRRFLPLITRAVSRTFSLLPTKPTFHKRPHATLSLTAHAVSRAFPYKNKIGSAVLPSPRRLIFTSRPHRKSTTNPIVKFYITSVKRLVFRQTLSFPPNAQLKTNKTNAKGV